MMIFKVITKQEKSLPLGMEHEGWRAHLVRESDV